MDLSGLRAEYAQPIDDAIDLSTIADEESDDALEYDIALMHEELRDLFGRIARWTPADDAPASSGLIVASQRRHDSSPPST